MDNSSKLQALGKISSNDVGILLSLYGDQGTGELELGTIMPRLLLVLIMENIKI